MLGQTAAHGIIQALGGLGVTKFYVLITKRAGPAQQREARPYHEPPTQEAIMATQKVHEKRDVHQHVTDHIIAAIEAGAGDTR